MSKNDYMPNNDIHKAELFMLVRTNLPTYFSQLGITALLPPVVRQSEDALAFDYLVRVQQTLVAAGKEATSAKDRLRDGDLTAPNAPLSLIFPVAPGPPVPPVTPGVARRFREFVKWLKSQPAFTDAIGHALQLVGEEAVGADLSLAKPVLPLSLDGGHVQIDWTWQGLAGQVNALEIEVDRGSGTFAMLTIDTRPSYTDREPLPATGGKWRYRGIFREDDQRIGLWSDVAQINVG
jgi:hypothetical protein